MSRARMGPHARPLPARRRWPALALLAWLLVALLAPPVRAAPTRLRADPPALDFAPQAGERRLRLHNDGDLPIELAGIGVRGEDWGSFTITDAENPRRIPPHDFVELHLVADERSFASRDEAGDLRGYGSGRAHLELRFEDDDENFELPLSFAPAQRSWWPDALRGAGLFALLFFVARRRPRAWRDAPAARWLAWAIAAACVLALLPLSEALCPAGLTRRVGELELLQCSASGGRAALLDLPGSAAWLALAACAWLARATHERELPGRGAAAAVLLLVLAALCLERGSLELDEVSGVPLEEIPAALQVFGGWPLVHNPLTAAALLWLLRCGVFVAFERVLLSVVTAVLILGAWRISPTAGYAPHAWTWSIGLAATLAKAALLLRWSRGARSPDPEHPARVGRGPILLAVAGLVLAVARA